MSITLHQFEQIDGLLSSILRMGPFETCADPRAYVRTENRLFDACVDAMGFDYANGFASGKDCAVAIVTKAMRSRSFIKKDAAPKLWAGSGFARNYSIKGA